MQKQRITAKLQEERSTAKKLQLSSQMAKIQEQRSAAKMSSLQAENFQLSKAKLKAERMEEQKSIARKSSSAQSWSSCRRR